MNVLHVFNSYLPKTQTWAFNILRYTPGVEVHVAANSFLINSWWEDKFRKAKAPGGSFQNLLIKALDKIPLVRKGATSRVAEKYREKYIKEFLEPYCIAHSIDLIHVHFANVGYEFLALKTLLDIPYIVSFYGMDYEYFPNNHPEYIDNYKELFAAADGFICEGEHGRKVLTKVYGVPVEKTHVVHLGVATAEIPFHSRIKKEGQLRLVQIASFVEKKGHQYTLAAVAEVAKDGVDVTLTLVGDGPLKEEVLRLAKQLGISDIVNFVNFIDYAKLHEYLRDFDVFIHASCYAKNRDCEGGAPVVILDAQATGLPVIATSHCDIPSEVLHGVTGLLSNEKEILPLADNIRRFCDMENTEYQKWSIAAKEHVKEQYSIRRNSERLKEIYDEIING